MNKLIYMKTHVFNLIEKGDVVSHLQCTRMMTLYVTEESNGAMVTVERQTLENHWGDYRGEKECDTFFYGSSMISAQSKAIDYALVRFNTLRVQIYESNQELGTLTHEQITEMSL